MSFWKSFFGHAAANTINEIKKEERENKKWNDLFHEMSEMETDFNDYLRSIGSSAIYVCDVTYVNNGNILPEKQKIEGLRKKINDYLTMGGLGKCIEELDELDQYIELVNLLKSKGCLHRLEELSFYGLEMAKITLAEEEAEQECERQRQIEMIVGSDINKLSGIEFEHVCQSLVNNMGFQTQTTKASGDGGIDLIAYNYQPLLSGKYIIQCKRYSGSVGEPVIRDLYGVIMSERANKGILMTTGHFTKSAIAFAEGKPLELIDGQKMNELLQTYGIRNNATASSVNLNVHNANNDYRQLQQIFENNFLIGTFESYNSKIKELEINNDERARAQFINLWLDNTMSECSYVSEFEDKLIFFKEIKHQIKMYLENSRIAKSKYLAFIYQMIYVQLSILQGEFKDAKEMFALLMQNKELIFSFEEMDEPKFTKPLYNEHTAIFSCLYYTYYDMSQMASILGDDNLHFDLNLVYELSGVLGLNQTRIKSTIATYAKQGQGRDRFWRGELTALENIKTPYCMYFMSNYEPHMYYQYTYENGTPADISLDRHPISFQDDEMVVEGIGTIKQLSFKKLEYYL